MTDQEKLLYIEMERAKLQKRLLRKTGLIVTVRATIHNVDGNGNNQTLARAGLANGWTISHSGRYGWVATPGGEETTVFFELLRQRRQA